MLKIRYEERRIKMLEIYDDTIRASRMLETTDDNAVMDKYCLP